VCRAAQADLLAFVADVWPLAQEDPDVVFGAREFLESGQTTLTA
jgi:hypothetical protein